MEARGAYTNIHTNLAGDDGLRTKASRLSPPETWLARLQPAEKALKQIYTELVIKIKINKQEEPRNPLTSLAA
jgi:hypothetical protein